MDWKRRSHCQQLADMFSERLKVQFHVYVVTYLNILPRLMIDITWI